MTILLVGFLLTTHSSLAQSLDEATALTQQIIELYKQAMRHPKTDANQARRPAWS
jgi:hypothetical protein